MSTNAIYRYFQSNYGEVERVGLHTIPNFRFAVVTFKHEENVKKASQRKQHTIDGHILNVSIADEIPEQCHLLSLNDDCILEILKLLELKDLCSISNACSRLRCLAQTDFASKYKSKEFALMESDDIIADFLRSFGSQMQSIHFIRPLETPSSHKVLGDTYILHLLSKYCDSLTNLALTRYEFRHYSDSNTLLLIPLLARLKTLSLDSCILSDKIVSILVVAESILTTVLIRNDHTSERWFSRLKTLKLALQDINGSSHFLHLNSVEHIEIGLPYFDASAPWPAYRRDPLNLHIFGEMTNFKNLKTLKAYTTGGFPMESLRMIKSLIHLSELTFGYPSEFNIRDLLTLIRNGTNLERMTVIFDFDGKSNDRSHSDQGKFDEMVDIVLQRKNEKPLNVAIVGDENQIRPFDVVPADGAPLKIVCLSIVEVSFILDLPLYPNSIRMSTEDISVLRDRGLSV